MHPVYRCRTSEGEHLKADLVEKLHHMASNVEKVEQRAPQILTEYRAKLQEKVQELLGDTQIDEARLSTEIILFADKICTRRRNSPVKEPYYIHAPGTGRRRGNRTKT